MQLKACLVLLWVDQEAGNVDEVEADSEEERLLALRLEDECDARLIIVSQVDQVTHPVDQLGHQSRNDALLYGAAEDYPVEDAERAFDESLLALLLAAVLSELEDEVQVGLLGFA